ncbi:MAG: ABC transporter permease subunit [Hyphomicrobiales bacterium]
MNGDSAGGSAIWTALSLLTLLLLWWAASVLIASPYLPTPSAVARLFVQEVENGNLQRNVGITLARVAAAAIIAFAVGAVIGIVMGRRRLVDRFFDGWLVFFLNVPALITIVLCYLWIGLNEVAAVTAVALNKIPNVAVTMREGARSLDPQFDEMARSFRFGTWKTMRHVVLPQLQPFFAASARSGLALIWKIVLVVELLGRSSGVGFEIATHFQMFEISYIFVYALAFMAVIQAIDLLILKPWERSANRWRLQS